MIASALLMERERFSKLKGSTGGNPWGLLLFRASAVSTNSFRRATQNTAVSFAAGGGDVNRKGLHSKTLPRQIATANSDLAVEKADFLKFVAEFF